LARIKSFGIVDNIEYSVLIHWKKQSEAMLSFVIRHPLFDIRQSNTSATYFCTRENFN